MRYLLLILLLTGCESQQPSPEELRLQMIETYPSRGELRDQIHGKRGEVVLEVLGAPARTQSSDGEVLYWYYQGVNHNWTRMDGETQVVLRPKDGNHVVTAINYW